MGLIADKIAARLSNLKERDAKLQAEIEQLRDAVWTAYQQLDDCITAMEQEVIR